VKAALPINLSVGSWQMPEGYDELTYRPRGHSWFVLSGYRGDDIYYEKVMFSCAGQVINVMAITYPSGKGTFTIPSWSGWKITLGREGDVKLALSRIKPNRVCFSLIWDFFAAARQCAERTCKPSTQKRG
jgi:hypothetical protein